MADVTRSTGIAEQIRLVAGLRWQILRNSLRKKNNRLDLIGLIFAGFFSGIFVLGLCFAFYGGAYFCLSKGRPGWMALLFWGIFFFWQVFPVFVAGFGASFEFRTLLRFPLSLSAFYVIGLAYGLADFSAIASVCWLLSMTIGATVAKPGILPAMVLIVTVFVLFNVTLAVCFLGFTDRVAHFIENVFRAHDRSAVELCCYSTKQHADEVNARLKQTAKGWREIEALNDDEAAAQVRDDGIDILVDLSGHTQGNRLGMFARKPAPVQCTWLGYVGTTGLATMDYLIGDRFVTPAEDDRFYREAVYRLPGSYLCFNPPAVPIETAPLPSLQGAPITFGSCNSLYKLTEHVLDLWASILLAVPGSRLLLKNYHLTKPVFADQIIGRLAQSGVGEERLLLSDAAPRDEILATYNQIDIALDPFPYGGGTTTAEALWMGVPVITWRGDRFVGRVSESILTTAGVSEFVATSAEDYVDKAVNLAADLPRLAALRAGLRDRVVQSPLCDAARFTRGLEDAYRTMWTRWCDAGEQRGAA